MRLETERLILREYTMDDFDALYEILSDPETMKHYPKPYDEAGTNRWLTWSLNNYKEYGFGLWAIELKENGKFIGDCGITMQNIDGQQLPEIGYHIHKNYWRKGYAKEAATAVRDWAFANTEFDTLYSYMKYTNVGSYSTAASIGMTKIKEYPDDKDGILYVYAITREDGLSTLRKNLETKGYLVKVFADKKTAAEYMNSQIDQKTVGFGGSVTIRQMDLFKLLSSHNTVYWHDEKPADMSVMETRTAASRSEIYISSVNAISEKGEIVNIDNTGNRVAAISYGPEKVYLVIGSNKVTDTLESAIYRARNVASPMNAKRLNRKTPCAVNGDKCYDCNSPERICRNLSVLWTKPTGAEYEIILIKESLGY